MPDPHALAFLRIPTGILVALDYRPFHFALQPYHHVIRLLHVLFMAAFFGGIALLACRPRLRRMLEASTDPDEQAAYAILLEALEEPIRTIAANAGYDAGAVMAQVNRAGAGFGFDVRSGQVVDMAQAGIFDIAAAQKAAVHGAIAGAALALTVDVLIHKRNPESTPAQP